MSRAPLCSISAAASAPSSTSCSPLARPTPTSVDASAAYLEAAREESIPASPRRSRHVSPRRFRRTGGVDPSRRHRHARSRDQRVSGLGTARRAIGSARPTPIWPRLSAGHVDGEDGHLRHDLVLRLRRKAVRASIRPDDAIERIARENGLNPHVSRRTSDASIVAGARSTAAPDHECVSEGGRDMPTRMERCGLVNNARTQNGHIGDDTRDVSRRILQPQQQWDLQGSFCMGVIARVRA